MAAKKTPPAQSKSAFIRAQPAAMSAADVVAQGRAAGITLRPELVYEVRRVARARTASGAKGASGAKRNAKQSKSGPAKTAEARSSLGKATPRKAMSKAEFVRAHASASPKEITEKAAAAGITLGTRYIYNVRGSDRAAARKKTTARPTARPPKAAWSTRTKAAWSTRTKAAWSTRTKAAWSNVSGEARSGSPRKGVAVPRPIATASRAEDLLKALGAEVGLAKAIEILSGERARVKAVLGG